MPRRPQRHCSSGRRRDTVPPTLDDDRKLQEFEDGSSWPVNAKEGLGKASRRRSKPWKLESSIELGKTYSWDAHAGQEVGISSKQSSWKLCKAAK